MQTHVHVLCKTYTEIHCGLRLWYIVRAEELGRKEIAKDLVQPVPFIVAGKALEHGMKVSTGC
jgi:hypothetical protein